jgi:hypothetical protein
VAEELKGKLGIEPTALLDDLPRRIVRLSRRRELFSR